MVVLAFLIAALACIAGCSWLRSGAAADGGPLGCALAFLMIVGGGLTVIGLFVSAIF